jgi:hypothetical protein
MLSRLWLKFEDKKIEAAYTREKMVFYKRVMPLITFSVAVLLILIEVIYRRLGLGSIHYSTTVINSVALTWFTVLTCLTRSFIKPTVLICPSLLALVFYYITWLDYDSVNASIHYKTVLGITVCFFLLVVFNEMWLLTTLVYAPFCFVFLYKTGADMLGEEQTF